MTYLRQHRREEDKIARILIGTAVFIVLIVSLIQYLAPHIFPALFTAIARPFWREEFAVTSGALRSPSELLAENESLKRQLSFMRTSYASSSVALIESENKDLLSMFGRASTTPKQYLLGAVLAHPAFLSYDELVIDVGEDDGVASTSLVYSGDRVLIGHVVELLSHSAKIILYSSPHESYGVSIGPNRVPATAVGLGGGQYKASVPHGSLVEVGDFVSDSALYDRPFGVVVSVMTDPSNPFDAVSFAPPVNIYQLRFVLVDTGKARPVRR